MKLFCELRKRDVGEKHITCLIFFYRIVIKDEK